MSPAAPVTSATGRSLVHGQPMARTERPRSRGAARSGSKTCTGSGDLDRRSAHRRARERRRRSWRRPRPSRPRGRWPTCTNTSGAEVLDDADDARRSRPADAHRLGPEADDDPVTSRRPPSAASASGESSSRAPPIGDGADRDADAHEVHRRRADEAGHEQVVRARGRGRAACRTAAAPRRGARRRGGPSSSPRPGRG